MVQRPVEIAYVSKLRFENLLNCNEEESNATEERCQMRRQSNSSMSVMFCKRVPYSQRYIIEGLVGLGLPLTVTVRPVSIMVSVRVSVK